MSLEKLILHAAAPETISDQYYCSTCCRNVSFATRTFQFLCLPDCLFVSLSRFGFTFTSTQQGVIKRMDRISIPLVLDFPAGACGATTDSTDLLRYGLCGIVAHVGKSATNSHYVAYRRQAPWVQAPSLSECDANNWVLCNDSSVSSLSRDWFASYCAHGGHGDSTPYILCFRRVATDSG